MIITYHRGKRQKLAFKNERNSGQTFGPS